MTTTENRDSDFVRIWTNFINKGAGYSRRSGISVLVLNSLLESGEQTAFELEQTTGLGSGSISSAINALRNRGDIEAIGMKRRKSRPTGKASNVYRLRNRPPKVKIRPIASDVSKTITIKEAKPRELDASAPEKMATKSQALRARIKELEDALQQAENAVWNALEDIEHLRHNIRQKIGGEA